MSLRKATKKLPLGSAKLIAFSIVEQLKNYCEKIEVVGSIRRKRPYVGDIDIVLIPHHGCMDNIKDICLGFHPIFGDFDAPKWGERMASFIYKENTGVDLYFADAYSWPYIKLIRTGSAQHNIFLCSHAKSKGLYLAADGSGLFKTRLKTDRVRVDEESDIFKELGLNWKEPEEREV